MFPTLFTIGTFSFPTIWLFIALAILIFSYIVFLQSEEEHLLATNKVFDIVIISAVFGLIFGGITSFLLNLGNIASGLNFWAAVLGSLATLFYFSPKFKLPKALLIDIASLAFIPAVTVFYLGKLVTAEVIPVNIFSAVWFVLASWHFLQSSKRIQFPRFYLFWGSGHLALIQLLGAVFLPSYLPVKIFNLTVSSLILTIASLMLYIQLKPESALKRGESGIMADVKNFSQKTLVKIKNTLLRRKKTLEGELASIKKDDPFLASGREQSRETGEDAYEFEGHERATVISDSLKKSLEQVKRALAAVGLGKYGKCEKCGKEIEKRRLKVLPHTTLCFSCEREIEGKGAV